MTSYRRVMRNELELGRKLFGIELMILKLGRLERIT